MAELSTLAGKWIKQGESKVEQLRRLMFFRGEGNPRDKETWGKEFKTFVRNQQSDERSIKPVPKRPKQPTAFDILFPRTIGELGRRLVELEHGFRNGRTRTDDDLSEALERIAALDHKMRQMRGTGGTSIYSEDEDIEVYSEPFPTKDTSFSYGLLGTSLKINVGNVIVSGSADVAVGPTTLTLSGSEEYVFVQILRGTWTCTIEHSSTKPADDSTYIRWRLYHFTATTAYSKYYRDAIYWIGDIHLDTPTR